MIFDQIRNLHVFQIGVGGTGSWLVAPIAKFLNNLSQRFGVNTEMSYTIVDDDTVEDRNILRQNFTHDDIGRSKSVVHVRKNFMVFKNLFHVPNRLKTPAQVKNLFYGELEIDKDVVVRRQYENSLTIIFGCVDNNDARQLMYSFLKNRMDTPVIYFDCGNNLHSGQIVTNWFRIPEEWNLTGIKNKQVNFKKMFPKNAEDGPTQSCAFFGDQSQSINMFSATMAFANLQTLIINNQMPPVLKNFNSSGYSTFEI
jgi:molybdopterin/thiamine biosynthesis adenylyltransferase